VWARVRRILTRVIPDVNDWSPEPRPDIVEVAEIIDVFGAVVIYLIAGIDTVCSQVQSCCPI